MAIDSGAIARGTREARIGKAVGEIGAGLVQMVVGAGGSLVGGGLSGTGGGALVGVPIAVASAGLLVNGYAEVGVGVDGLGQAWSEGSGGRSLPQPKRAAELPQVRKTVNSNMPHAIERAVGRKIVPDETAARAELEALSRQITKDGLPAGTIRDTAHADRVLVPFGTSGYAVYQVGNNGTAKLKTVLNAREVSP